MNVPMKRPKTERGLKLHELADLSIPSKVLIKYVGPPEKLHEDSGHNYDESEKGTAHEDSVIRKPRSDGQNTTCEECQDLTTQLEVTDRYVEYATANVVKADAVALENCLRCHSATSGFVAVGVRCVCLLPIVLLGVLKSGNGFYPLSHNKPFSDCERSRNVVQFNWAIVDSDYMRSSGVRSEVVTSHRIQLQAGCVYLIKLKEVTFEKPIECQAFQYAYAIRTSGTTGKRRIVFVPHDAIVLNILDLVSQFNLTSDDVVLAIAPPTFDPSVVDLFIALYTSATIIYVSEQIRLLSSAVLKVFADESVTCVQCTPSFLLRLGEEHLRNELFSVNSKLRCVALGGEKCFSRSFLRSVIPKEKQGDIQVFNLYGITEVSCWASVEKINLDMMCDEVSLGKPLNSIVVQLLPAERSPEGEILIGFDERRRCHVQSEDGKTLKPFTVESSPQYNFFQTGDHGRYENGQLFYVGRLDRIRKRNGMKIDLQLVEDIALEEPCCSQAFCVDWNQDIVLAVKLHSHYDRDTATADVYHKLRQKLPFECYPDRILFTVDDLPLNENGKLDWYQIIQHVQRRPDSSREFTLTDVEFQQIFYSLWNFYTTRIPSTEAPKRNSNFILQGGNSMSVNLFVEDFFDKIQRFGGELHLKNENRIKCALINKTAEEVEEILQNVVMAGLYKCRITTVEKFPSAIDKENEKCEHQLISPKQTSWKFCDLSIPPVCGATISVPMGLCVDATPLIMSHPTEEEVVLVGSHSGSLHCFSVSKIASLYPWKEGHGRIMEEALVWRKQFPSRLESSVVSDAGTYYAYIGCHDGKLYKISAIDGAVKWKFDAGVELRSSPAVSQEQEVVVVNTDKCIYCVNSNFGLIRWMKSSSCYIFQTLSPSISHNSTFVSTVEDILALSLDDGSVLFKFSHANIRTSPLPLLMPKSTALHVSQIVVFGDSHGALLALDQNGKEVWSSPGLTDSTPNELTIHSHKTNVESDADSSCVVYTTHNGDINILDPQTGEQKHQTHLHIQTRSRPCVFDVRNDQNGNTETLSCCCLVNSKNGSMFLINFSESSSSICRLFDYGNDGAESFSSPSLSMKYSILFVGSRDNCVHMTKLI